MATAERRIVDLDKLKIPFAIDASGRWIKAPEVDLAALPIRPTCPGCGELVTFRRGSDYRIPHFAHRANSSCSNEGYEGLAHQKLKEATAGLIDELGAGALIHKPPPEVMTLREAVLEEPYPKTEKLRSDVGVPVGDGRLLGFEIVVSHELSIKKVNAATAVGNLVCAMNGFEFMEHIIRNGGEDAFDIDADARTFVLKWRFGMKRGTPVGTTFAKPARVGFVGGSAVNCAMPGAGGINPVKAGADAMPLYAGYDEAAAWIDMPEEDAACADDLTRQHALRLWHTRPDKFPEQFRVHLDRGDFDEAVNE